MLAEEQVSQWLEGYKEAWETQNPEKIESLFADNGVYHVDPFHEKYVGREEISEYWKNNPLQQEDILFSYDILSVRDNISLVHWTASFRRDDHYSNLDGVFKLTFDEAAKCLELREWWHKK